MTDVVLGKSSNLSIEYFDQNGQPMATPASDAPPAWTQSTPATETLTVASDGLTATLAALALGNDIVSLSVIIGGKTFSATVDENVVPPPQVLTSIAIKQDVQP